MTDTKTTSPVPNEAPTLAVFTPEELAAIKLREGLEKLRAPFPEKVYGKLYKAYNKEQGQAAPKTKCKECGAFHSSAAGVHLDYVGHAAVTDRLLAVDPEWNWEPLAWAENGLPLFLIGPNGTPVGLWMRLTVLGVSRLGFGTVEARAFDPEKQLIGDALRNAAMRFGVALDLWSKEELESALEDGINRKPPQTVQEAAARDQAKDGSKARITKPKAGAAPAETAPWDPAGAPAPAPGEPGGPRSVVTEAVAAPKPDGKGNYIVFGLPVPAPLFEDPDSFSGDRIKSKQSYIDGLFWGQMWQGGQGRERPSVGGNREQWLRHVVKASTEDALAGKKLTTVATRAATALWYLLEGRAQAEIENERIAQAAGAATPPFVP